MKWFSSIVLAIVLVLPASSQPNPMPPAQAVNVVDGLALPADFTVDSAEGFIELEATTTGEVRWYVLGSNRVKYKSFGKTVLIALTPQGGQVVVLAIAQVDGKLTEFARCNLTVTAISPTPVPPQPIPPTPIPPTPIPPGPGPPPTPIPPGPAPTPIAGRMYVTIVEDPQARTPALAQVINSAALRDAVGVNQNRGSLRVVASTDPFVKAKNLDGVVAQAGRLPVLIIQDETGVVRKAVTLPATEAEAVNLVKQLRGP